MMTNIYVYVAFAVMLLPLAYGLSCGVCREENCPDTSACAAGTMMDDCGCCAICSKAEGEKCAGRYGRFGNCGDGLTCDQGKAPPGTDPFYHWLRSDGHCVPAKSGSIPVAGPSTESSTLSEKGHDLQEQSLTDET